MVLFSLMSPDNQYAQHISRVEIWKWGYDISNLTRILREEKKKREYLYRYTNSCIRGKLQPNYLPFVWALTLPFYVKCNNFHVQNFLCILFIIFYHILKVNHQIRIREGETHISVRFSTCKTSHQTCWVLWFLSFSKLDNWLENNN